MFCFTTTLLNVFPPSAERVRSAVLPPRMFLTLCRLWPQHKLHPATDIESNGLFEIDPL
jgi:hypothetical protein